MSANIYLPPTPVVPGMLLISAITQSFPMVITIVNSIYNTYVVNQLICLTVPSSYGMFQANELTGKIVAISSTSFSVDIDSRGFDPFVIPIAANVSIPASLAPAGCKNLYNVEGEPFHSLTNQGN